MGNLLDSAEAALMKVVGSREDSARGPREDELRPMRAALGGDAVKERRSPPTRPRPKIVQP